jgi:phospholipid/cholesterol/gamma-HCH transport system permease protein
VQGEVPACRLASGPAGRVLQPQGAWRLAFLGELEGVLGRCAAERPAGSPIVAIDGTTLVAIDSAAALLLCRWLRDTGHDPATMPLDGFDPRHRRIFLQVAERTAQTAAARAGQAPRLLARVGAAALAGGELLHGHLSFFGLVVAEFGRAVRAPTEFRAREFVTQISRVCLSALPVVALVTALIGLVFAYLLGLQAEQYGANIFVVDGVALGMTREFSPLIVATIVAGRSGASFAAQLGTMRLNEETDAIRVLGMSVGQVLILPRVLALMLSLPLLVFVGDLAGLAGAALIADLMLGITPSTFVARLHDALAPRHVVIGLIKAPVFALLIAVIGCRMGMTGARDTRTIGMHTTSTVVQGIVGVIVIDAIFAIVLQGMGL